MALHILCFRVPQNELLAPSVATLVLSLAARVYSRLQYTPGWHANDSLRIFAAKSLQLEALLSRRAVDGVAQSAIAQLHV